MKKVFLTFASSDLSKALSRIHRQALDMKCYDDIRICDENSLDVDFRKRFAKQLAKNSRGYGYWCWKPQIILQTLNQMNDGDVLQYTDAGCHLNPKGLVRLKDYFNFAINASSGILAFEACPPKNSPLKYDGRPLPDLPDYKWVKGDLLDYFKVRSDQKITHTPTIGAGIIFIKKCSASMEIIEQWLSVIKTDFSLIDDTPSKSTNIEGFIEHRHDQSIFSILCKINSIETLSGFEYWYPKKDTCNLPSWREMDCMPVHAKRDKQKSIKSLVIAKLSKLESKFRR